MNTALLLLVLASSHAFSHATMSQLSKELLTDGLDSLDEHGGPTTACMVSSNDGASRIAICPTTDGFGPRSVACFTVWNGTEVIQQGCYSNQELSLRSQCKKRECKVDAKQEGVIAFCCCFGPLCNA